MVSNGDSMVCYGDYMACNRLEIPWCNGIPWCIRGGGSMACNGDSMDGIIQVVIYMYLVPAKSIWRLLRLLLSHIPLLSYVTSFVVFPTTFVVAY